MNLSLYLSRRLSGSNSPTGRTGGVIAVLGVAFALAVMEITMAVVVGFRHEIIKKLDGFIAPVSVTAPTDFYGARTESFISLSEELTGPVRAISTDATLVPVLTQPAIIKTDNNFAAVVVTGHEDGYPAEFEKSNLVEGQWAVSSTEGPSGIVLSRPIASRLGLETGDKTTLCFFIDEQIKARPFTITGIYDSGFGDFDKIIVYAPSNALRGVNKLDSTMISRLEVRGIDVNEAEDVARRLSEAYAKSTTAYAEPFTVTSVNQEGGQYLSWLELLDTNVVVIFILMALVASVTLISSLFILVLDKVKAIGILRSLGASDKLIRHLFTGLSMKLVGGGIILGNIIGLGFIFTQAHWHYLSLDPEMYYLTNVPVEFSPMLTLAINLGVIALAWAVIMIPARFATRLSPVSTFRFE